MENNKETPDPSHLGVVWYCKPAPKWVEMFGYVAFSILCVSLPLLFSLFKVAIHIR